MISRLFLMKIVVGVGIALLVIGLTMMGAGLYIRRRRVRSMTTADTYTTRKAYSHIDLDEHMNVIRLTNTYRHDNIDAIFPDSRIRHLKRSILQGKQKLMDLESAQDKYSNLVIENNIKDTHRIVNNKIVYSDLVIRDYPDLHKHLIELHKTKNNLRYNRDELDSLTDNIHAIDSSIHLQSIDDYTRKLINNAYELNKNAYNQIQASKQNPHYDGDFSKFKGQYNKITDSHDPLTSDDIKLILKNKKTKLLTMKMELERLLTFEKYMNELLENMVLKL